MKAIRFRLVYGKQTILIVIALVTLTLTAACGTAASAESTAAAVSATPTESYIMTYSSPAPQFGVVIDAKLQVIDVEKNGAAEKAGVQKGDILVTLDGVPLTSASQARQTAMDAVFSKAVNGETSTLTLNRKGQQLPLTILPTPPNYGGTFDQPVPTVTPVWDPYQYF